MGLIVPRAFSYIIVIVFTRLLAPTEFGLYSLVITYGEMLDSIFMDWSRLGMLRFFSSDSVGGEKGLVKANLYLYGLSAVFALLGAILLSLLTADSTSPLLFFCTLATYLLGNSTMRFGLTILRAQEKRTLYTILEVLRPTLSFAGIFLLIPAVGISYSSLALGFFGVTAFFGSGTMIWATRNYFCSPADWQAMNKMLRYAIPLIVMFFFSSIIRATDRYMLDTLSGTAIVGLYAASYSISRPIIELIFNAINLGAFPKLINHYEKKGEQHAAKYLEKIISILLYLGLPIVAGITVLAQPLANILLGDQYRQTAILLMPLMALTGLLAGLKNFAFDQVFHMKKCSMMQSYTLLPAVILNITLNYILIPPFGARGATWATLLSYLLALLLSIAVSRKLFPVSFPFKEATVAFFSSLIMWIVLFYIGQETGVFYLFIAVPSGITIYFLVSSFFKSEITNSILHSILYKIFRRKIL